VIKAIVFDFGNVISEPQDITCFTRMSAMSGISEEALVASFWKYRPDFDRGTIRGHEMYLKILAEADITGNEAKLDTLAEQLLAEDLGAWFHISPTVTEWGLSLQESGYILGILSNMPVDFLEHFENKIELFSKADVSVFSCRVDQIKPEPAIYRTLIDRLGCKPDEIVFFDDIQANVDGALKAGIRAFLWTGLEQAKKDWKSNH